MKCITQSTEAPGKVHDVESVIAFSAHGAVRELPFVFHKGMIDPLFPP